MPSDASLRLRRWIREARIAYLRYLCEVLKMHEPTGLGPRPNLEAMDRSELDDIAKQHPKWWDARWITTPKQVRTKALRARVARLWDGDPEGFTKAMPMGVKSSKATMSTTVEVPLAADETPPSSLPIPSSPPSNRVSAALPPHFQDPPCSSKTTTPTPAMVAHLDALRSVLRVVEQSPSEALWGACESLLAEARRCV